MPGHIFISYRRDDTQQAAEQLKTALHALLPGISIYLDLVSNEGAENYRSKVNTEIAQADVFLCLIGPRWLEVCDANGKPRLHAAEDLVCEEIDSALDQGKVILPVLVDGAKMPSRSELPVAIKRLARQHAMPLTQAKRSLETGRIASRIAKLVKSQSPTKAWRERLWQSLVTPAVMFTFFSFGMVAGVAFAVAFPEAFPVHRMAILMGIDRSEDAQTRSANETKEQLTAIRKQMEMLCLPSQSGSIAQSPAAVPERKGMAGRALDWVRSVVGK